MTDIERRRGIVMPDGLRSRGWIVVGWIHLAACVVLCVVWTAATFSAPALGLHWRADGVIEQIIDDSAADRAGLRAGDRILAANEYRMFPDTPLLYYAQAHAPIRLSIVRDGEQRDVIVSAPVWTDAVRMAIHERSAGLVDRALRVVRLLANWFALALALFVAGLRSRTIHTRLAALVTASWVGCNSLLQVPGFGTFAGLPSFAEIALIVASTWLYAAFFGFLIHFALVFPRPFAMVNRRPALIILGYAIALPVFALQISDVVAFFGSPGKPLQKIASVSDAALNASIGVVLLAVPLLLIALHLRFANDATEKRRAAWILAALVPGIVTWMLSSLVAYSEPSDAWILAVAIIRWAGMLTTLGLFTFAVVRRRLFELKFIVRLGLQYAMARWTLSIATAVPLLVLVGFVLSRPQRTVASLFTEDLAIILGCVVPLVILLRYRAQILERIDRRFFREHYDARQALLRVLGRIERGTDTVVLGRIALLEIERAFHPTHSSLWLLDSSNLRFQRVVAIGRKLEAAPVDRSDPELAPLLREGTAVEITEEEMGRKPSFTSHPALLVPLTIGTEQLGFLLLGERLSEEPYETEARSLLESIAHQLALTEDYSRLEVMARRDPLTEALNRHAFYSLLDKKRMFPFETIGGCAAIFDINDLKSINDRYGHPAGDQAIRSVASAVRGVVRADDLVFRWGGDEFLVIVFGLGLADVRIRFDALGKGIQSSVDAGLSPITVTVAFGIAEFTSIEMLTKAIELADRRMYDTKRALKESRVGLGAALD
ncbi:MAG: diguanylate cyclase [Thermoanaerobaculia bacterium]